MAAQRQTAGGADTVVYLHGDRLGSVVVATSAAGAALSGQDFRPWGERRAPLGDVPETDLDVTGQRRDGSGLLYYGALLRPDARQVRLARHARAGGGKRGGRGGGERRV